MKICVIFLFLGISATSFAHKSPIVPMGEWSDSGIHGPKYSEILKQIEKLQGEYPDLSEVIDYGKSVRGKTLRMIVVMKKNLFALERPALIMSGSTHGNEYLNIEDRLPETFLNSSRSSASAVSRFLDQGGALVLIPILNPDGYDSRDRENANGVDLNRDWDVPPAGFKGFKEVETQTLAVKLQQLTLPPYNFRYKISVDYHCCAGALLYPWAYTNINLPEEDENQHIAIGALAAKHLDIDYGTTGKILGYNGMGTTKDYYYDRYKTLAFTFEGRFGKENLNYDKHVSWWEEMLGAFAQTSSKPLFSFLKRSFHPFLKIAD